MSRRAIIHVDMDAFFAAIEQQRHPEYKGKPVVVGGNGDPHKRGVVSTASYEARKYGIKSAMPLKFAYRKCPHAIFLPVDFKKYSEVSQRLMKILRDYTSLVESLGLDEAFLDVTESERNPVDIAREIKRRITEELGLTASVGVAPNKLLAKIASGLNKPDGLTSIGGKRVQRVLSPLPVFTLWGVGRKTEIRLKDMGISTIGDLAKVPLKTLQETFGKVYGRMLYNHARGMDETPVIAFHEPKSMGRETTFQVDTTDLNLIRDTLSRFVKFLVKDLRHADYRGRTITVKIRYSDFSTHTRSHTLPEPVDSQEIIYNEVRALLSKFDLTRKV
ncbi:MAG: DNA polymerase IV, partial [Actinomycetota bacterium]